MKTAFSWYDIVEFRQMIEMKSFFNFVPGASEWNLDNAFSLSWVCSSFCSSGMSAACSEEIVQVKFLNRNFNKTHFYCQRFMKQGVLFDATEMPCHTSLTNIYGVVVGEVRNLKKSQIVFFRTFNIPDLKFCQLCYLGG